MESEEITRRLTALNELEQKYGRVLVEADPNYDPSGEANAQIQSLKDELAGLGVSLKWDGWQYEISPDSTKPDGP